MLNYSATNGELPSNCYRKTPNASFEWKFSCDDNGSVILLSAQYSYNILSQQGCFSQSILGGNKDSSTNHSPLLSTGKPTQATRKKILIGVTVGSAGLFVACLICLILHKHKKLKFVSSSSKLITRGNTSDRYFHDPEMTGPQCTQIFSYEELEEATEGFSASKELGDGGFGTVYKDELADPALGFQSDPEVRQMVSSVAELAFRCLQPDRDMRPSIKEVLEVLRVIQNGGYDREKIAEISPSKEEAHLLERGAIFSPNTVMSGWMSQSTTPNTMCAINNDMEYLDE
ncbi:putative serine/threonine-protein kinase [Carex littledalei]|uniref:Putative serine/threonine-protein kinase n=1 Tax=Carex littledalei TaxID=544730 RepID=A0A833V8S4_9POAL|nr:putative serine/threonine-protein kinase [Carex littledalei]